MRKCAHAYAHILGTCELRLRMLRSWGKFRFINTGREACATEHYRACALLPCTRTRRGSMRKCAHANAHFQRKVQSRPQSSSLLRMTDDGNSSGQSDFRSSADWLLKHNSITTGSEDDTGVNKDG